MEHRPNYDNSLNGIEVTLSDIQTALTNGALADDRVLADLLRLHPYDGSIAKAVIPYEVEAQRGDANRYDPLVTLVGGSNRTATIKPCRFILGTPSTASTDIDKWRDIRSVVFSGDTVALASPDATNPRWDLLYAQITRDKATQQARYRRDPDTGIVAANNYTVALDTTVTIQVVTGTASASPARPAIPSDTPANDIYIIPIAYVRVSPSGGSVAGADVYEIAPVVSLATATGAVSIRPADWQFRTDGAITRNDWPASTTRPGWYIAPSMIGGAGRIIQLDFVSGSLNAQNGDAIDKSIDWRNRFFRFTGQKVAADSTSELFATDPLAQDPGYASVVLPIATTTNLVGLGQSFFGDGPQANSLNLSIPDTEAIVALFDLGSIAPSNGIAVTVNLAAQGELLVRTPASWVSPGPAPSFRLFIWLEATGPMQYV